jgi:hypothetical protein
VCVLNRSWSYIKPNGKKIAKIILAYFTIYRLRKRSAKRIDGTDFRRIGGNKLEIEAVQIYNVASNKASILPEMFRSGKGKNTMIINCIGLIQFQSTR